MQNYSKERALSAERMISGEKENTDRNLWLSHSFHSTFQMKWLSSVSLRLAV
jgi:hypothetical protein